jgi:hypothetical protein
MMARGKQRGILRPDLDPEVGFALLLGPLIYSNVFLRKLGAKSPKDLEVAVADSFLRALGTKQSRKSGK